LSIGTLQLSTRCSSIHFVLRRSFPVIVGLAGFGAGWPALFCAFADNARQMAKKTPSDPLHVDRMMTSPCWFAVQSTKQRQHRPGHPEPEASASVAFWSRANLRVSTKEEPMNPKRFILAGCATLILSASTAMAGPCDTSGRAANLKDAGSGPASTGSGQTTGMAADQKEHPPTSAMNRATGDVAASSQDAQKQMQGQPTAAQEAQGAKPDDKTAAARDKDC
jgi:hypothetical protein